MEQIFLIIGIPSACSSVAVGAFGAHVPERVVLSGGLELSGSGCVEVGSASAIPGKKFTFFAPWKRQKPPQWAAFVVLWQDCY